MLSKIPNDHLRKFIIGYIAVFFGLAGFLGGMIYARGGINVNGCCARASAAPSQSIIQADGNIVKGEDAKLYSQVWSVIQDSYVKKPVNEQDLFYGSLEGMVDALEDPFSSFLRPKIAERFTSDLKGSFFGIGAEIGVRNDRLLIIAPLLDTPADKAGLLAGDHIVNIDGEDTINMTVEEAVDKIRGPKGKAVVLGIFREGFEEITDFTIIRDEIVLKSVSWEVDGDLSIITVSQFGADTMKLFSRAIRDAQSSGVKGVVIDLRNNPGGFLITAVQMASEWIPEGPIVIERFSDGYIENYMREGKLRLHNTPTVVLVNFGSASGSEIVAGALQDYGQATVVGEKTFGKGSVQDLVQLPDGSAVKITIAEWFTPLDRNINGEGITPDIEVEQGEDLAVDDVLEKAKEILRK